MTISKFRSRLYGAAKVLGDVQAVSKASRKQSFGPIFQRIARRLAGKLTGRLLGRLFR